MKKILVWALVAWTAIGRLIVHIRSRSGLKLILALVGGLCAVRRCRSLLRTLPLEVREDAVSLAVYTLGLLYALDVFFTAFIHLIRTHLRGR